MSPHHSRPVSSPQTSALTHQTFSSIIEADHSTINRCAGRLRSALSSLSSPTPTPLSEISAIRDEVVWRLIRHDISEEMVMRPAFLEYMGEEGRKIGENDRQDHSNAKTSLQNLQTIPLSSPAYITFITNLMAELVQHMKRESGHEIPRLESILSRAQSLQLANEYARTQLLTPAVRWPPSGPDGGRRVFATLNEYAAADIGVFRRVLDSLGGDEGERNSSHL